MDQLSFASLDYAAKKKHTKRDVFLAEMAAVVPWVALEAVIEPHYPKAGPNGGRRPFPLAVMLRIYCLQQWYNLSDPGAEEAALAEVDVDAVAMTMLTLSSSARLLATKRCCSSSDPIRTTIRICALMMIAMRGTCPSQVFGRHRKNIVSGLPEFRKNAEYIKSL